MSTAPLPGPRRASLEGASATHRGDPHYRQHPEEESHLVEQTVPLPAEVAEEELVLLREAFDEGASRGWKLLSAIKQPGGEVLVLTWDTLVSFQG